ncbi:MAG: hypothetical protein IKW10_02480 [Oscillospiraceae bacterium]|nr:hypothetical protein [Oscillospiraceae bacterium]
MKRLISWLLALTLIFGLVPMSAFAVEVNLDGSYDEDVEFGELLPGYTEANPIDLTQDLLYEGDFTATVTVPAGTTLYYCAYRVGGMIMTINGGAAVECVAASPWVPYAWSITNDGAADAEYVIVIAAPLGSMDNPATLTLGENNATVAADAQGYFYTYTAEQTGTLVLEFASSVDGWSYTVNNMTTYKYGDTQWSDSDPVVNPAEIEVTEGDEIEVIVNTYDPANMWGSPAGTVTVKASYKTEEPAPEYNVVTNGYGLSLEAELVVSAKFVIPQELKNDPNATITIQFIDNVTEYNLQQYAAENGGYDSKNRIVVKQSVRSPWMPHLVKVTICDGNGNAANYTDYFGETFEGAYEFGAETYVKLTTVANPGKTTIDCVRGLLTYGAYAQDYFESTGKIPNIPEMRATEILTKYGYEPMDISQFSSDLLNQAPTSSGDSFDGISSRGVANPVLEAAIYMTFQFNATGITEADIGNYTYKLSYMSGNTLVEKDITPTWDARGRLVFTITEIAAMYFDCMYSVTITKNATGETYTAATSVVAYMDVAFDTYEGVASQAKFLDLLKAMYYYNQAANTHFGK